MESLEEVSTDDEAYKWVLTDKAIAPEPLEVSVFANQVIMWEDSLDTHPTIQIPLKMLIETLK